MVSIEEYSSLTLRKDSDVYAGYEKQSTSEIFSVNLIQVDLRRFPHILPSRFSLYITLFA